MHQPLDVVITGTGVVSSIGIGSDDFWKSLLEGRSGIGPLREFDAPGFPANFGAEIPDFDPKLYVQPRKSLKVMCREIQTGFSAAVLAMRQAGLEPKQVDPERLGVVYGSEILYSDFEDLRAAYKQCIEEGWYQHDRWGPAVMTETNPLWMLKYLPNMPACHVAIYFDGRGHNNTICMDSVSGLMAIAEAVAHLRRGLAEVMIVGGTGTRIAVNPLLYRGDEQLSHRSDAPERACRPFDLDRDGLVGGEGAAAMILETREHAEARGREPLATVLGYGSTYGKPTPDEPLSPTAIAASIEIAMREAEIDSTHLSHINASGTSLQTEDRCEAQAIQRVLPRVPVTGLKSYFGHTGAGCGVLEAVASVMSLQQGIVPRTLNYDTPDPNCPIMVVRDEPLHSTRHAALTLNQNRTGQCAALVLGKP
ncbi:MAG: beta-ketoacyl-[acyl-carrier-protein] synthase family protein [Pirellulaceae bacterium]